MGHPFHAADSIFVTAQPFLNIDIILLLMNLLNYRELIAMMQVCRDLYAPGVRLLIQEQPGLYMKGPTAEGFLNFVLNDVQSRSRYLRAFRPSMYAATSSFSQSLLGVLKHAHNLELLWLTDCERLEEHAPGIVLTIAGMKKLRSVSFQDAHEPWRRLLENVDSPIIRAMAVVNHPWLLAAAPDASQMLVNCTSTLKHLTVNMRFYNIFSRFSNVVSLELLHDDVRGLDVLIEVFPNLRELHINLTAWWLAKSYLLDAPEDEVADIRRQNQLVQWTTTWKELDFLQGDARSLYALGLCTKVKTLTVDMRPNYLMATPPPHYPRSVIEDASPHSLMLQIRLGDFDEDDFFDILHSVPVRYVSLDVLVQEDDDVSEEEVVQFFYVLARGLHATFLSHLTVCLSDMDAQENPLSPRVEAMLKRIDMPRCARELIAGAQSLSYLRIFTPSDDNDSTWRIINDDRGELQLQAIPSIGDPSKNGEDLPEVYRNSTGSSILNGDRPCCSLVICFTQSTALSDVD
ncbi:hypothetical protein CERSUDRAFT_78555 [Gelatoporia subvermispora B]|uniref:F-box domain-containing protein n=1 Tax=Ceriporiopsis subvermispora (strain B) TaxID=914234 RepID=M2QWK6_CERS8|nr:hypothetical protein CERSUDRAFT_78555 [Gelatoporia subvermispora B]